MSKTKPRFIPAMTNQPADFPFEPTAERVNCPTCEKLFCHIETLGLPMFDNDIESLTIHRMFFCDHCEAFITFFQLCDIAGVLTGGVVGQPIVIGSKRAVEKLLKDFPQLAGVA